MIIKPKYVFQANSCNLVQQEFSTKQELLNFIHSFDFRNLYDSDGKPTYGITRGFRDHQFRVGARLVFEIDGYQAKSNIIWGPKYYVGRSANCTNNILRVEMPVIPGILYGNRYYEEYKKILAKDDMVFDPVRMCQVYPPCKGRPSQLTRFIQQIEKQKYNLDKVR
ncbi:MAG: hypothetical protein IIV74_01215 [Alphaproteobacteria bacterium]|nr:hypothetical protein [Alphaproteobacteria bacterium]